MEQVTSMRPLWGKAMPHIPVMEKNGVPYTSAVARPTLGLLPHGTPEAAELPPHTVLRGTCVTQFTSVPRDISCIFSYCC